MLGQARTSFIFITTSSLAAGRNENLDRLISSIREFALPHPNRVKLYVLLQQATDSYRLYNDPFLTPFYIPDRISLSAARNYLLKRLIESDSISKSDIVAFPDDDCWFPKDSLNFIYSRFEEKNELDLFFCKYASNPGLASAALISQASMQSVISHASSNTMFIRGWIVSDLASFDERLGLGAPVNGGEDTDFAIRSYKKARKTEFLNCAAIGHRDYDSRLRGKYFPGSFVAILSQACYTPTGYTALLRKMLVGIVLLLRGEMRISTLYNAILAMSRK